MRSDKSKVVHTHYHSVDELLCVANADNWNVKGNRDHFVDQVRGHGHSSSWHGIDGGFNAVMKTLTTGYKAGEQRIDTMLDTVRPHLPMAVGIGRVIVKGDRGDALDIHAVNRGDLSRAWTSRKRLLKAGKSRISIVVDICGNRWNHADTLAWRGVAGIALAEIMTKAGYQSELIAGLCTGDSFANRSTRVLITTTVKPFGVSADRGMLAATIALTGFFRTLGFTALLRAVDAENERASCGLGHAVQVDGMIPINEKVSQLIVPTSIKSEEAAVEWVKDTVKLLQAIGGRK